MDANHHQPTPSERAALCAPKAFRLPEPMLRQIDAIVASRLDQPHRSAVLRELVAEALEARRGRAAGGTQ
jgi:hypothetical protein